MKKIITQIIENKWLLLILIVATILRFYNLDFQSLWMDEIYTMNISSPNFSLKEFHSEMLLREGFPYLYYILIKISYVFFGYSAYVARGFSAIMGILSVYAIYILGKELSNKRTGLIAAVLLAINEYCIYISQDARLYTLYLLITIFSFHRLVVFLKSQTIKNTIWYGVSAGLLISVNFFGFINLLSQSILVLYFIFISEKRFIKTFFLKSVLAAIIAIVIFLPNYDMLLKLLEFKVFWVPKPTDESFELLFKEFLGNFEITLFIFIPLFIFYLINVFQEKTKSNIKVSIKNTKTFSFLIYLVWSFVFIFFLMVKSYGEVSLILTRYFISVLPVIILLLATSISFIRNRIIQTLLILVISLLTLSNLFVVKKYYFTINKAQFKEASLTAINNNPKDHEVYTSQKYWFDYYFTLEKSKPTTEKELETVLNEMAADSTKIKSFWFVDAFGKTYNPSENSKAIIAKYFVIDKSFDGFQAWAKHFVISSELPQSIDLSGLNIEDGYNDDSFMFNIEAFEIVNNKVNISGWAYFDGISSENSKVSLVLINKKTDAKKTKIIPIQSIVRQDVTSYFKCNFNADNSGFKAEYDISNLENEVYVLGVYLENKILNKKGLFVSDKKIKKE
ncbi:glycosyltransferase family 39 protein [Flavobacterium sp.]|uniref:glycosyltransferase family 39 protein n=1 Tax=Flavobacterium sp. TaxID=239 RepID=UPI003D265237